MIPDHADPTTRSHCTNYAPEDSGSPADDTADSVEPSLPKKCLSNRGPSHQSIMTQVIYQGVVRGIQVLSGLFYLQCNPVSDRQDFHQTWMQKLFHITLLLPRDPLNFKYHLVIL